MQVEGGKTDGAANLMARGIVGSFPGAVVSIEMVNLSHCKMAPLEVTLKEALTSAFG